MYNYQQGAMRQTVILLTNKIQETSANQLQLDVPLHITIGLILQRRLQV